MWTTVTPPDALSRPADSRPAVALATPRSDPTRIAATAPGTGTAIPAAPRVPAPASTRERLLAARVAMLEAWVAHERRQ
jgi:hypothetical protein